MNSERNEDTIETLEATATTYLFKDLHPYIIPARKPAHAISDGSCIDDSNT